MKELARLAGAASVAALVASLGVEGAVAVPVAAPLEASRRAELPAVLSAPPLFSVADAAAPAATATAEVLPEGQTWRYSEFINAVESGKVERVRFSKDGSGLQLTAVDGCATSCTCSCGQYLTFVLTLSTFSQSPRFRGAAQ